jgi:hypothetical protein
MVLDWTARAVIVVWRFRRLRLSDVRL